jgi:hypothetical protein
MSKGESATGIGVIILGMHRSGTSLAAEIAYRWGAYAETKLLMEPNDGNLRGYWEYRPLVELNDALLAAVHSSWKVPPTNESQIHLAKLAKQGSFRRRALRILATMNSNQTVWFWKDPRLCILLPFWKEIWRNVVYLIPIRDPMASSCSLRARGDFSIQSALLLWQRYMSAVISDEDVSSRALFFSYEELLSDSSKVCDHICQFLDKNSGTDGHDRELRLARMSEAVEPQLHRNRRASSFSVDRRGTETQRELYRLLMCYTQGCERCAINLFPMPSGWRNALIENAITGQERESFHLLKKLLRPVKWRATTLLQQIINF